MNLLLAKHKLFQSLVLKINSTRIKKEKYNLQLTIEQARNNKELVALGSSQVLRFIQEWENKINSRSPDYDREKEIDAVKFELKQLKKEKINVENRRLILSKYKALNELLFNQYYLLIIMDSKKDFDRLNSKKGFMVNGHKFKRLLATTGGGKKSTVVYVREDCYSFLTEKLDGGRNMNLKMVPAKLEAYKALACSASTPVSNPKGVLIVNDVLTTFKSDVIRIDDTNSTYPIVQEIKDYLIEEMNASDGYGLMLPWRSRLWGTELGIEGYPSLIMRNLYLKGVLHPFDYIKFGELENKQNYIVPDAWGEPRDIRNYDVIVTTSMAKLWKAYDSLEHYNKCWKEYGYQFSVTKSTDEELDNERSLNYQFIQSLELSDEDIEELIKPTIQEIKDVLGGDYRKSLLFLRGTNIDEKSVLRGNSDFVQALMIDKEMINDPYVKNHIHKMIKKRIDKAKTGVLSVEGNFSLISGDPFLLCQSIYSHELTGLLEAGQYYSNYWNNKNVNKVAAFRAPMTNHNNIRVFRFVDNDKTNYWYRYMNTVTIFNGWDTATHALNGCDMDGDAIFTTNNPVVISRINELDAIVCMQKTAAAVVPTEEDLIKANKLSFGDEIGTTTNRITAMFDVRARYEKDSKQYKELTYRIMCGQLIQQNVIDKSKGIEAKGMPKHWYDRKSNLPPILCDEKGKPIKDENGRYIQVEETDEERELREFNLEIVADQKPYFFIWKKKSSELTRYKKYIEQSNRSCVINFGMNIDELLNAERTSEQNKFIEDYHRNMPVSITSSVMNRISRHVEKEFENIKVAIRGSNFDKERLKTNKKYSLSRYKEIKELYRLYGIEVRDYMINQKKYSNDDEESKAIARNMFVQNFKEKALTICNNEEDLCNMVIDLCYKNDKSKQFAWDVAGEQIIKNLLNKNDNQYSFPKYNETGDIEYKGERYEMITIKTESDTY